MSTNPRAEVHASTRGTARFDSESDANAFETWIYDRYDQRGYGTSCHVAHDDGMWVATWYVGSCE